MGYQALYRRYRPARFEDFVGQEAVIKTLRSQITSGRIAHAYLFCGTRGTGKTSTAKVFARAVNCEHPENGDPCGTCDACRALADENSLDILEIDAASNNGVDEIRDLREKVKYPPQTGRYRVYIIDEVHMLSQGAFNALLKTLEEPPAYVVFILATTEPQKLPATILSRCQRFDFGRIPAHQIIGRLRVTGVWNASVLSGGLASLLLRGVPYALIYTTVVTTAISILTTFGQLRFAGSIWQFVPALFLGAMANTWVAYLLSWNCKNPGEGAGCLIFLVPVGFILGGATMAVGFLHGWVKFASFGIPLVWIFKFWRDIGLRGIDWAGMADLWGCFFGYLTFIALLVGIRFWREEVKMMVDRKDAWETLRDVENAPAEPDPFPDPDGRRGEPIALRPTAK